MMHLLRAIICLSLLQPATATPILRRSNQTYLPDHLIALEEHTISPSLEDEALASGIIPAAALAKLTDVGAGRIADLDAGHISLMVLSQAAALGMDDPEGCIEANNFISDAVEANPTRFAGFAVLPLATPDQAAAELERAVQELDFKGAMIYNHLKDGTYFDGGDFDPIFSKAVELDVSLYLHPAPPTPEMTEELFAGNYVQPQSVSHLGTDSWGWHVNVGTHVLRLYAAGIFDRFPTLKIILGHNGEDLPMMIDRVDATGLRNDSTFAHVWETNIWTTTSCFFTVRAFQQLRQVMPVERIMYSVDYPLCSTEDGWNFVQQLAEQQVLTDEEMDLHAYKNAETLLKL